MIKPFAVFYYFEEDTRYGIYAIGEVDEPKARRLCHGVRDGMSLCLIPAFSNAISTWQGVSSLIYLYVNSI
jgi:hypothetical protein